MTTEPCGQANPKSFRYHYFEARMRHETVHGNGPAWWLFSTRHATNPSWPNVNPTCQQLGEPSSHCISGEIDVLDGFGRIDTATGPARDFFNSGIHRNSSNGYGVPNEMRLVQHRTSLNMADWHVYAAKWTTSQASFYIDGQLQGTVNTFDSIDQPMHLILSNWNTSSEGENMPNPSTEPELDTFVDWVRVWQQ
jgi:beta-glucanase (GH16 family)